MTRLLWRLEPLDLEAIHEKINQPPVQYTREREVEIAVLVLLRGRPQTELLKLLVAGLDPLWPYRWMSPRTSGSNASSLLASTESAG
ncbi:hypothetical protein [Natronococcus pandeyae]|uniref:hypothetical protein n=1 Tax=Natronococcus pandeyae TaxID=2055836 RepID=UPI0011E8951F|nr:hypothetical protein [Natronococcus pandeyae]